MTWRHHPENHNVDDAWYDIHMERLVFVTCNFTLLCLLTYKFSGLQEIIYENWIVIIFLLSK